MKILLTWVTISPSPNSYDKDAWARPDSHHANVLCLVHDNSVRVEISRCLVDKPAKSVITRGVAAGAFAFKAGHDRPKNAVQQETGRIGRSMCVPTAMPFCLALCLTINALNDTIKGMDNIAPPPPLVVPSTGALHCRCAPRTTGERNSNVRINVSIDYVYFDLTESG